MIVLHPDVGNEQQWLHPDSHGVFICIRNQHPALSTLYVFLILASDPE